MKFIYIVLTISCFGCVLAQTPNNVKESFWKKYPNAKDVTWNLDKNAFREAKFELDGVKYRADFTLSGDWVETETNIKWKDLPESVQDAFKTKFDKDDIEEIEKVQHHEKGLFYDVEIKKLGEKTDVEFSPSGQILKIE